METSRRRGDQSSRQQFTDPATAYAPAVQMTAIAPGRLLRRAAPVAGCVAVAVGTVIVATHDPAASGSRFPACAFHSATGLWCPGCGLTRGLHALLDGHLGAALSSNVFTPLAAVGIIWLLVAWICNAWDRPAPRLPDGVARVVMIAGPALLLAYGVLRNIPLAPFRALAP